MTATVQFGQIVWAELADPNGIRKPRPAVIVTPNERITSSDPLEVVAITSRLPAKLPDDHILALAPARPSAHRPQSQMRGRLHLDRSDSP